MILLWSWSVWMSVVRRRAFTPSRSTPRNENGKLLWRYAVALHDGHIFETCATLHAAAMAAWCRTLNASVVGIDAPCRLEPYRSGETL